MISGHFHKYQQKGNLTYLGTPFSHSFGETDQTKYIGIYDTESDELKLERTPFRKHLTIEIDCDKSEAIPSLSDIDLYRIILCGKQENIDKYSAQKSFYKDHNVKWITRPADYNLNDIQIDETSSNEKQFNDWAKETRNLDDETIKLGLEIMESVK